MRYLIVDSVEKMDGAHGCRRASAGLIRNAVSVYR
jgi:hypothetical protein